MANAQSTLLGDALAFALRAHDGQTRKGNDVPYVTHCIRVAALVIEYGGDEVQTAAALLHDTIEDCEGVTEEALRGAFGREVADIVAGLTDTLPGDAPGKKSPWRERKVAFVRRLPTLGPRACLVSACDKLDNLQALVVDLDSEGPGTLERFTASPRQTRWYYEAVRAAFVGLPADLTNQHDALLVRLARHVTEASLEP